jgi:tetratricopeptide (TPR) repeat protein
VIHFPERQVDGIETVDFPWLVEPDHDSLKKMMRHVYEYPEEASAKGKAARIQIERNFTWEKAAEAVGERLEALSARPIRRFNEHAPPLENEAQSPGITGGDRKHPESMIAQAEESYGAAKSLSGPAAAKPWDREVRFEPDALEKPHRPADSLDIADFLNTQGELLFGKGKRDHARACFEMAIEHSPNHAVAHSNLGVILRDLGELEAALESFHRALELAPEDSDILYNSSKALIDAGELDIAADLLKFYLQRNPRHEAVWEEYGSLVHQMGRSAWQAEGLSAEVADIYTVMGKELLDAKDYLGAGEALHRALRLNAHHVEAFFQLGRLHRSLDQTEEAVGVFRDALRLDSRRKWTVLALGDALVSRAEFDEAISLYEDYLAHQSDADVQAALEKASKGIPRAK